MKSNQDLIKELKLEQLLDESQIIKNQKKNLSKDIIFDGAQCVIYVAIRYDDECGNGHNSFSITGSIYSSKISKADKYHITSGCIHDEITKYFPKLKKYIKWHLWSSDSPMYYIDNTLFHAKESLKYNFFIDAKDKHVKRLHLFNVNDDFLDNHNQYKNKLSKIFKNYTLDANFQEYRKSNNIDSLGLYKDYVLYNYCLELSSFLLLNDDNDLNNYTITKEKGSEFKESNLKAARSCAIWEDATLEQLQDKEQLLNRLPSLMQEFKNDIQELGFNW